jgi:PIN domain nuclease of toxin-antitoxin system
MPSAVTDTHALIWYLQDDARLSAVALQYLTQCEHGGGRICVPSICLVEILYLSEKGRIPVDILDLLLTSLQTQDTFLDVVELNLSIVREMRNIPRDAVPDMPDRIIAATALHLGMPLISRDRKIQLAEIKTIW